MSTKQAMSDYLYNVRMEILQKEGSKKYIRMLRSQMYFYPIVFDDRPFKELLEGDIERRQAVRN